LLINNHDETVTIVHVYCRYHVGGSDVSLDKTNLALAMAKAELTLVRICVFPDGPH